MFIKHSSRYVTGCGMEVLLRRALMNVLSLMRGQTHLVRVLRRRGQGLSTSVVQKRPITSAAWLAAASLANFLLG